MAQSIFIVAALIISAGFVLTIILPLMRSGRSARVTNSAEYDLAVFHDQLEELKRDHSVGLLADAEIEAARTEIERRLLKAIDAQETNGSATTSEERSVGHTYFFSVCIGVVAVLASVGLYLNLGKFGVTDAPFADRKDIQSTTAGFNSPHGDEVREDQQMILRLKKRLEANPSNVQDWILLGRTHRSLSDYTAAAQSFRRAVTISDQSASAELISEYGEVLVLEAFGTVSPKAVEVFERALSKDPTDITSRFYIAASRAQVGNYRGAIAMWRGLSEDAPPNAAWLPAVREQISKAALEAGIIPMSVNPERPQGAKDGRSSAIAGDVKPDQETVNAVQQMDPSDQKAFIRSMVQRLADRMQANPDDIDGWLRLGRAYRVLGENSKAIDAFKQAKVGLKKILDKTPLSVPTRSDLEIKLRDIEALING